jgi:hypothetical protein
MIPLLPLLHFGLAALLVSGGAALSLRLAPDAPPRLKFWIAMLGLMAWIVPWPLIEVPALFAGQPSAAGWLQEGTWIAGWLQEGVRIAGAHARLATPMTPMESPRFVPPAAWIVLLAPGLVWFAFDYAAHRRMLRAWRGNSREGRALLRLLPSGLAMPRARSAHIRIVAGSAAAAASGVWTPTLWIGERLSGEALRAALVHEHCHVQTRDPLWLLLIQLIKRAYCWNPVVALLSRQAELWLEADCDRRCARILGRSSYSAILARLILSAQRPAHAVASLFVTLSRNLRRLELLRRTVRIGWREYACVALCAATSISGVCLAAAPRDPRIGNWAEVGETAPDDEPILRSFEDLGDGLTRLEDDIMNDGSAALLSDHRCDGESYGVSGRLGEPTGWVMSCRILDPLTVEVTLLATDGSRRSQRSIDRISPDGETYTSTVTTHAPAGAGDARVTRVFWRLH